MCNILYLPHINIFCCWLNIIYELCIGVVHALGSKTNNSLCLIVLQYRMMDSPVDSDVLTEAIPRVGVTDAERELANNAHVEFESKQYDRYQCYFIIFRIIYCLLSCNLKTC